MALQGNPFLGKLKIPAPDLSRIPDLPFETKADPTSTPQIATTKHTDPKNEATNKGTIREQLGNGLGNNKGTIREQLGNKTIPELNSEITQKANKGTIRERIREQRHTAIREQLGNGLGNSYLTFPDAYIAVARLTGHQKKILDFAFDLAAQKHKNYSGPIQTEALRELLKTSSESVNTSTKRLIQKRLAKRRPGKRGEGGFIDLLIPETVYDALAQLRDAGTIREQLGNGLGNSDTLQLGNNKGTDKGTSLSSSSSVLNFENFKITTTSEPELLKTEVTQLSLEWQLIDYSLLTEIGFTESHLVQVIRQGKLSSVEVQDSILFFAFDLKRNRKGTAIHGSPLNFFMGILRRGQAYAPPENYESPEAEARRKYLEGKRSLETRRLAEEAELQTFEFTQWKKGLSETDITALVPEFARQRPGQIQDAALLAHFEKEIWPTLKGQVPGFGHSENNNERVAIQMEIKKSLEGAMP